MGGANATLRCHLMSGDFEDDHQYTPTIDDNLTQSKEVWYIEYLHVSDMKSPNMDACVHFCTL